MDKVVNELSTLTLDYKELANALYEWPVDKLPTDSSTSDDPSTMSATALGPSLIRDAVHKMATATHTLANRLSQGPENVWIDGANYGETIKNVLKNRDALQVCHCISLVVKPSLSCGYAEFRV